ncbi:DUF4268 domain-containing protein [Leisingera sp. HS039]|uniref:DUF4268 domain-containing protein n=1 Tax=unclassified Leisingera TaxID=2614906 RepID=UPI001070885C|nr:MULTISPECIES: DUF4268 domain-containing protein [unclassified Leisingera]MBQ4824323.1 DUF4268 domain-containing protein [Leisingera sp. HS039]QBR34898.1 DUF4268 domain-containing protein [Leisingera sp. NJS201]
MTDLGRLEKIDLRDIWRTEDQDFTPWLAREGNIGLLADALGLELEVEAQEKEVGPFRADILCKDLRNDSWVLIENQLERTDHKHLGQLITYAAGLKAVTIVWVAATFTEEHRAALDWLNTVTDDDFRFFALEVELWRIGDSPAAPKFNIVSKPNEWSKTVGAATRRIETEALTGTKQRQLAYWQSLADHMAEHPLQRSRKARPQSWTIFPIGKSGMHLGAVINTREEWIGIELYLGDENAHAHFLELSEDRAVIESDLGFAPEWLPLPEKRACRIILYKQSCPLSDEARWPEYHDWMVEKLDAFNHAFRLRVRDLDPDKYRDVADDGEVPAP